MSGRAPISLNTLGTLAVLAASCAPAKSFTPLPPAPASDSDRWSYEMAAGPAGRELAVSAVLSSTPDSDFTVVEGAEPFVRDVVVWRGSAWEPVMRDNNSWSIPSCADRCLLRYRFLLQDAATALGDRQVAQALPGAVQAPPSSWLLRPRKSRAGTRVRFHVTVATGDSFVSGVPVTAARDTYELHTSEFFDLPYAAFGRLHVLQLGNVQLAVPASQAPPPEVLANWVRSSTVAVESYYGTFPVGHLLVLVQPIGGDRVGFGSTMGASGAAVQVAVGRQVSEETLRRDWVLVHEMVHTALPKLSQEHHWLEEGVATYVGPIARARAGQAQPAELWREWLERMPYGLPRDGDLGLDRTPTWGRTYWGGAVFCLLADIAIRRATNNRRSIDDALRAITSQGGNISVSWPIERVLAVADQASEGSVFQELYARMAARPESIDLDGLWKELGVAKIGIQIVFDDSAPLAHIRQAMTARPHREPR